MALRWVPVLSLLMCLLLGAVRVDAQDPYLSTTKDQESEPSPKSLSIPDFADQEPLPAETRTVPQKQRGTAGDSRAPSAESAKESESTGAAAPFEISAEDEALIKKMPLRKKVGQLFIFGFMGTDINENLGPIITRLAPGGIIIFGRNIKSARQLADLNFEAQKLSLKTAGLPLLIAVDQEGGSVIRIKTLPPLPSALALSEAGDPELVKSAGFHTGTLLKTLGLNMNLAPVLDVTDPNTDAFIGTRSYGNDPVKVALMGGNFAVGLKQAGVLPTAKHFPGHGGVNEDSHRETPAKNSTAEQLWQTDLLPFAQLSKEISDWSIMVAHVAYPKLDPSGMPATFSKPIVTDLLRKKMNFQGIVVTDDIEMTGAFAIKDVNERAIRAIEAGVDLIMLAWNKRLQAQTVEAVVRAVKSGRIPEERINESLRRLVRAKRQFSAPDGQKRPTQQMLASAIRNNELRRISQETILLRFKAVASKPGFTFAATDPKSPVFVFAASERFYSSFKENLKGRPSRLYRLSTQRTFDINKVLRANPLATAVFYISGNQSARYANEIGDDVAPRVLLVNTEARSFLKNPRSFRHIIDVYFRHPDLGRLTSSYFFQTDKGPSEEGVSSGSSSASSRKTAVEGKRDPATRERESTEEGL